MKSVISCAVNTASGKQLKIFCNREMIGQTAKMLTNSKKNSNNGRLKLRSEADNSHSGAKFSYADSDKKPTRLRKKKETPDKKREVLSKQQKSEEEFQNNKTQNSKPKTQNSKLPPFLPWKAKRNVWLEKDEEFTFGPPPKTSKIIKQRRSASQKNLNSKSSGEQGKLLLEALKIPEQGPGSGAITHGFHPYPGRFHPDLPRTLLKQFPAESVVFDPFMGGGTVLLEGLLWKHQVLGNDLNPIAKMVAQERCRWLSENHARRVWGALEEVRERVRERSLEKRNVHRPKLRELKKYHPPYLFVELLHWIDNIDNLRSPKERETLRAVFSSLIVKFSHKLSETSAHTKAPSFPKGAVGKWMERKTQELLEKQLELADKISKTKPPKFWNENILALSGPEENSINCTITGPPYPGAYDYFEHHQLRMKWLNLPMKSMSSGEIADRNYSPKQWKQVFREFMLKLRRWTAEDGVCYLVLGDWLERGKRVSGLDFTQKYADSIGWKVTGSASIQRELFDTELKEKFGESGKWEHLILLRQ